MTRKELIKNIENLRRNTKVICYVTGDRQPFPTKIASDTVPLFDKHLLNSTKSEKISLFLYTRGGDMLAPLSIVKSIRNHCKELEVLIPYHSYSAGTSIALGANRLVMGRLGELSPTDPATEHPFNPDDPKNPSKKMEISVEDVNSFFLLAKEKAAIRDQDMISVFKSLTEKIHPIALGNVYRAYRMSRTLSEKLLKLHLKPKRDEKKIQKIVEHLTGLISIHNYPITRDEAKDLGLNVEYASPELEKNMWDLYQMYSDELQLGRPYNALTDLGTENEKSFRYSAAFIESEHLTHSFVYSGIIHRVMQPQNQLTANLTILSSTWEEV